MNWQRAIERNREALLRIVAVLFTMAGLDEGAAPATLPRHLRSHVLRVLRPAESAVRRLVMIAARDIVVVVKNGVRAETGPTGGSARTRHAARQPPAFPVIDPLPHFLFRPIRRRPKGFPRISIIGVTEPRPIPDYWIPSPHDPVDAKGVCRRLRILKAVLDDLDKPARRLARWRARRDLGLNRCKRFSPMRPGRPPGHRKRPSHEIDDVLRECHALALHATSPPDTG